MKENEEMLLAVLLWNIWEKGWKPRLRNGVWDGTEMLDGEGQAFVPEPEYATVVLFLFINSYWGPLRGNFPGAIDHPKPKSATRRLIVEQQLRPYIDPNTGRWDGKSVIDTEGRVKPLMGSPLLQLRVMVMDGYYGKVPWHFDEDEGFRNMERRVGESLKLPPYPDSGGQLWIRVGPRSRTTTTSSGC